MKAAFASPCGRVPAAEAAPRAQCRSADARRSEGPRAAGAEAALRCGRGGWAGGVKPFGIVPRRKVRVSSARRPCAAAATDDYRKRDPKDIRVLVVGSTGYIGKFVVQELVDRGFNVVAFARSRSGIGGKASGEDVIKGFPGADVKFGDVTDVKSLESVAFKEPVDVVVSCLASRTGGKKDSWLIDYQASLNCLEAGRACGMKHYVLLSAICVQKPLLEFQKAKLALEAALQLWAQKCEDITYSIVRPTAFFKSIAGQVDLVKEGKPYVMFGDGTLASCKPISEADLASFIADCVLDDDKTNKILPIGGPSQAYNALQQAQLQFELSGKEPKYIKVPVALMDGIIGVLDFLAGFFSNLEDAAEFARIGKYYATESMLVWDPEEQKYKEDETPSYGKDTLEEFFEKAIKGGLKGQELGDQAVFKGMS
eukprot:evm.model.scf_716.7 EVM.evm.TU.scf_716.7   scf_716:38138-43821(-)